MAVEDDQAMPFSMWPIRPSRSGRRRCAGPGRPAGTPGTSCRLAVLRHEQVARLISHPKLRQGAGRGPPDRNATHPAYPEQYFMTSLTPNLAVNWRWQNTNPLSCTRNADGTLSCTSDHPNGFDWCVNAPAIDVNGTVFSNSEDGNLYEIDRNGNLLNRVFTQLAIGAAYTPLSIGPDGKIYTQNDGRLFVTGY